MLSVKNFWVTRNISHEEIVKVAKSAQENTLQGIAEQPQVMGSPNQFVDSVFNAGLKKTTLNRIHGMSHHTAALHLSKQQLNAKIIEIHQHIAHIQKENAKIDAYTKNPGFVAHRMYQPDQGPRGLPMNFHDWCEELKKNSHNQNL